MSCVTKKRRWQTRHRNGWPTAKELRLERKRAARLGDGFMLQWWPSWAPYWFQRIKWAFQIYRHDR